MGGNRSVLSIVVGITLLLMPVADAVADTSGGAGLAPAGSVASLTGGAGAVSKPGTRAVPPTKPSAPRPKPTPRRTQVQYINPFADSSWQPGRVDMGMDWVPLRPLPVLAVGDAVILGSDSQSGWPGHHIIWYQLRDGALKGQIIYFAEHLTHLIPAGAVVHAGQQIGVALPGYPYIEMGWSDADGAPRAAPCYWEGRKTNSGWEMARFLHSLGADVGMSLGSGPASPSGRLC